MTATNNIETIHNVHPWRRYFARLLDMLLMGSLFYIGLVIFAPTVGTEIIQAADKNRALDMILTGFFAMLLNPISLCLTGSTLGKYLFGIKIQHINQEKLSLLTALRREFLVYMKGMAFCIPIASIFTLCSSNSRLNKKGKTSWDESLECAVIYRENNLKQKILSMVGIALYILFIIVLALPDDANTAPAPSNDKVTPVKKSSTSNAASEAFDIDKAKENGYIGRNKYIELMNSCSNNGNIYCSALLGDFYYYESEYHLAYPLLLRAEKIPFGKEDIEFELGYMLAKGYGVAKNEENAIYHFKEGANLGHHESAYSLGVLYGNRAAKLIDQKQSDQDAISNLTQSYAWYKVSKILGHETTIKSDSRVQDIDISIEYRKKLLIDRSALIDANKLTTKICASIPKCIERF